MKQTWDSKLDGIITHMEILALSRRLFENGTKRHISSSQINKNAFIYLILIKLDAQILLPTSELFDQQSSSVRNGLKVTPI